MRSHIRHIQFTCGSFFTHANKADVLFWLKQGLRQGSVSYYQMVAHLFTTNTSTQFTWKLNSSTKVKVRESFWAAMWSKIILHTNVPQTYFCLFTEFPFGDFVLFCIALYCYILLFKWTPSWWFGSFWSGVSSKLCDRCSSYDLISWNIAYIFFEKLSVTFIHNYGNLLWDYIVLRDPYAHLCQNYIQTRFD